MAVGLIKPHLPFATPKKYMDLYDGVTLPKVLNSEKPKAVSTWHKSGEFMKYNRWGKTLINIRRLLCKQEKTTRIV